MSVARSSTTKLRSLIRDELFELLTDPDFGRELKVTVKRRLSRSSTSLGPLAPAEDIIRRLGLRV